MVWEGSKYKIDQKMALYVLWGWMVAIIVLTFVPSGNLPNESSSDEKFHWDYLIHFFNFFVLGALYLFYVLLSGKLAKVQLHLLILAMGILLAVASEFAQKFISYRSYNPVDLYMNLSGVVLMVPSYFILKYFEKKGKLKSWRRK